MKKFIITVCIIVSALFLWNTAYYRLGIYIDLHPEEPVTTFMSTEGKDIYMERDGRKEKFEIRGVDLGAGIPGSWATDFDIDRETYLRWFEQIQDMGMNTIRIYTILDDVFYDAFYEYNKDREEPLYLIHGIWINDYIFNSHANAYDEELFDELITDCRTMIDIIHGKKSLSLGYKGIGSGHYRKDISPWVLGYILGVEWETSLVVYTNQSCADKTSYNGEYLYTTDNARPFEVFLCELGDKVIEYESKRYKEQRLVAFSNWPATDPFSYPLPVILHRGKLTAVDVEMILSTDSYKSGMFASYHIYPYFPDYIDLVDQVKPSMEKALEGTLGAGEIVDVKKRMALNGAPSVEKYVYPADYYDNQGRYNTFLAYLTALNRYHSIPVVISEYGVTSGRGVAKIDKNTGRNQGHMREDEQGYALIECYEDIMKAGCAGSCLFSWQDEWFKRTWNTFTFVDMDKRPYWSDYQTNEQFFGVLTFDPGKDKSICYVDGDISDWSEEDKLVKSDSMELSVKYDEKFMYFLAKVKDYNFKKDKVYIPIDTNPKIGSTYCSSHNITFENAADFIIVIDGFNDTRLLVQKRYDALLSGYSEWYYGYDVYEKKHTPKKDDAKFERVYLPLGLQKMQSDNSKKLTHEKFETGKLKYGNANPESPDFDSLADFIVNGEYIEIRLPWSLLNFSNPSEMMIHDDYYECYGTENLHIDEMYAGIGKKGQAEHRIEMYPYELEGWGKKVTFHERPKQSYYILKDYFTSLDK